MSPEEFAYWLQGFAELNATPPTQAQWQSIREHLQTVFRKVTPPVADPNKRFADKLRELNVPKAPYGWESIC